MAFSNWKGVCVNCTRIILKTININSYINNVAFFNALTRIPRRSNYSTSNAISLKATLDEPTKNDLVTDNSRISKVVTVQKGSSELEIEDVSDYAPTTPLSYNFAAFVNNSPVLQELVKLKVNLYKLERRKDIAESILRLDFEKDVKQYLTFLHDNGVSAEQLGPFITYNPLIFNEDIDNLQIRINYMQSKNFTNDMIARIITNDPKWLSFTTKQIDSRLGHFQFEFKLNGSEVRYLAVKQPRLITYRMGHIRSNTFSFKEEMGFTVPEMKKIILNKPRLFKSCKDHLLERFDYVHNIMKINHDLIASQPQVLTCRRFRIQQRHLFLQSLGRAQYDPKEPNYVSLNALISGTDSEFCRDVAKTSVVTFNMFQKTS